MRCSKTQWLELNQRVIWTVTKLCNTWEGVLVTDFPLSPGCSSVFHTLLSYWLHLFCISLSQRSPLALMATCNYSVQGVSCDVRVKGHLKSATLRAHVFHVNLTEPTKTRDFDQKHLPLSLTVQILWSIASRTSGGKNVDCMKYKNLYTMKM